MTLESLFSRREVMWMAILIAACVISQSVAFVVGTRSTTPSIRPSSLIASSSSSSLRRSSLLTLLWAAAAQDSEDETKNSNEEEENNDDAPIDVSLDPRLYKVTLSRAPGIDWGTDLSFAFVFVRDMDPTGDAAMSDLVQKGDQLCELTPIQGETGERLEPISLLGAPFDFVMNAFAGLDKTVRDVDLVLFRGTKDELKELCKGGAGAGEAETITVTVIQNKGADDEQIKTLTAAAGVNVRQLLVDNGINVYQSVTRWTNCNGVQLCGTCIVNITEGSRGTNQKSVDEASTLRENPESYRLSCVTFAYDDITVETFPPIKAAQWTR